MNALATAKEALIFIGTCFHGKPGTLASMATKERPGLVVSNGKDVRRFRKARRRRIDKDETAITQRTGYSVINFQKQAGNKKYGEGI